MSKLDGVTTTPWYSKITTRKLTQRRKVGMNWEERGIGEYRQDLSSLRFVSCRRLDS